MTSVIRGDDNFDSEGIVEGTASAWVNFNGSGTVAIRDSYNVSSITDTGTGRYDINYGMTMANDTYIAHLTSNTYGSDTEHPNHKKPQHIYTQQQIAKQYCRILLQQLTHIECALLCLVECKQLKIKRKYHE